VTRYWFRSADATSDDPTRLLPRAPESITTFTVEWSWDVFDESTFARLLDNHGRWCARNSDSASPNASLWALLELHRKQLGKIFVRGLTAESNANTQIDAFLAALSEDLTAPREQPRARLSWLDFALNPFPELFAGPPSGVSVKVKDALLKKPFTDAQIGVAYRYLTRADYDVMGGMLGFATYGGRINVVPPEATASAQRNAILDMACNAGWIEPKDADANLAWVRAFYRELFADTGGVPTPNDAYDGAFINHPDVDLADPSKNNSGVPWHALYYQMNYARLQQIKARWDPRNVFHHALSIRADR
jgi:aclacinomycin oxidase